MKRISVLVASALVMGLSFTSCGSDDDSNSGSILGKWTFSTEKVSLNGNVVSDEEYSGNDEGCAIKDYVEIFESTTVERDYFGTDCDFEDIASTYTRSGNTLTISDEGDDSTLEIVSVTSNRLVLKSVDVTEAGTIAYEFTLVK